MKWIFSHSSHNSHNSHTSHSFNNLERKCKSFIVISGFRDPGQAPECKRRRAALGNVAKEKKVLKGRHKAGERKYTGGTMTASLSCPFRACRWWRHVPRAARLHCRFGACPYSRHISYPHSRAGHLFSAPVAKGMWITDRPLLHALLTTDLDASGVKTICPCPCEDLAQPVWRRSHSDSVLIKCRAASALYKAGRIGIRVQVYNRREV